MQIISVIETLINIFQQHTKITILLISVIIICTWNQINNPETLKHHKYMGIAG